MESPLGEKKPRRPRKAAKAGPILGIVSNSAACVSPHAQISCTPQEIAVLTEYRKLNELEQRYGLAFMTQFAISRDRPKKEKSGHLRLVCGTSSARVAS